MPNGCFSSAAGSGQEFAVGLDRSHVLLRGEVVVENVRGDDGSQRTGVGGLDDDGDGDLGILVRRVGDQETVVAFDLFAVDEGGGGGVQFRAAGEGEEAGGVVRGDTGAGEDADAAGGTPAQFAKQVRAFNGRRGLAGGQDAVEAQADELLQRLERPAATVEGPMEGEADASRGGRWMGLAVRRETRKDLYGNVEAPFVAVNRKPILPEEEEIAANTRARSAKLRIAEKV